MTNDTQALIRRCVERAEGFDPVYSATMDLLCVVVTLPGSDGKFDVNIEDFTGLWLDALAAQLVRQVMEAGYLFESGGKGQALVWLSNHIKDKIEVAGPDRTMNTLRAIDEFYRGQKLNEIHERVAKLPDRPSWERDDD